MFTVFHFSNFAQQVSYERFLQFVTSFQKLKMVIVTGAGLFFKENCEFIYLERLFNVSVHSLNFPFSERYFSKTTKIFYLAHEKYCRKCFDTNVSASDEKRFWLKF